MNVFCDCVYCVEEKVIDIFLQLFYFETTIYLEKSSNKTMYKRGRPTLVGVFTNLSMTRPVLLYFVTTIYT